MIEVNQLSKTYYIHKKEPGLMGSVRSLINRQKIEKKAVKDISFNIGEGEIVGLIGSNGAGKTTLAKMLSGIIHPSSGDTRILGFRPWERDNEYRRQMALIMGQKASLWWDLPAYDCYLLLKEIYQIPTKVFHDKVNELSQMLGVEEQLKVQVRRLSLGERMKVELIAALLHSPKVVFLDEPTIGLDLSAQKSVRDFIQSYQKENRPSVVLTSHYMDDIEQLCKRVIIMKEGDIVYDGELARITKDFACEKFIRLHLKNELNGSFEIPNHLGLVKEQSHNELLVRADKSVVQETVSYLLAQLSIEDLTIENMDISDVIENILRKGLH